MPENKPNTDENTNDADISDFAFINKSEIKKMNKDEVEVIKIISQIIRSFLGLSEKKQKVFSNAFDKALAETNQKTASGKTNLKTEVKNAA